MSNNTDDTMRRIEEAIGTYGALCYARVDAQPALAKALATICAALQPDAGGWGEDDDRFRANEKAAKLEAWNDVDHGELAQARTEPVRPYSDVRAELLKPHEFTGRHRSYQDLLDEEHERAVEEALDEFQDVSERVYTEFAEITDKNLVVRQREARAKVLRLMRRQPKETP